MLAVGEYHVLRREAQSPFSPGLEALAGFVPLPPTPAPAFGASKQGLGWTEALPPGEQQGRPGGSCVRPIALPGSIYLLFLCCPLIPHPYPLAFSSPLPFSLPFLSISRPSPLSFPSFALFPAPFTKWT